MESLDKKLPAWPAFVHAKCPRCRRGNIFSTTMYGLKSQAMNKTCPHCGLIFEREPGYFYVSMLISYAMFVAEMVTLAVAIKILTGSSNPWLYVGIILSIRRYSFAVQFQILQGNIAALVDTRFKLSSGNEW